MINTIEGHKVVIKEEYLNDNSILEFIQFSKYPEISPIYVKYIDNTNKVKEDYVGEINLEEAEIKEIDGITTITSKDNEHIIEYNNKAVAHYINIPNNNPSLFLLSVYDLIKHEHASYYSKEIMYKELFKREDKSKEYQKKNLI